MEAFSRWAAWEAAVLARVDPEGKARELVAARQNEVDDDAEEASLVAGHFRDEIQQRGHDPDKACLFIPSEVAAIWLSAATRVHWPTNKASGHLATLGIPELAKAKTNGRVGWKWLGKLGPLNATMRRVEKTVESQT
jgi:hypothetical protein